MYSLCNHTSKLYGDAVSRTHAMCITGLPYAAFNLILYIYYNIYIYIIILKYIEITYIYVYINWSPIFKTGSTPLCSGNNDDFRAYCQSCSAGISDLNFPAKIA